VVAAAWQIITPHRLRVAFVQARIYSRNGRLPTIVRTRRQSFGERVSVWCHAGTTAADLRSARDILAAACWAADVRVSWDARHAHLVTLDVIRRQAAPDGHQEPEGPSFHNQDRPGCPLTGPDSPRWPEEPPSGYG
jgi:methyl coenzyme M reductase alpha subunit